MKGVVYVYTGNPMDAAVGLDGEFHTDEIKVILRHKGQRIYIPWTSIQQIILEPQDGRKDAPQVGR